MQIRIFMTISLALLCRCDGSGVESGVELGRETRVRVPVGALGVLRIVDSAPSAAPHPSDASILAESTSTRGLHPGETGYIRML